MWMGRWEMLTSGAHRQVNTKNRIYWGQVFVLAVKPLVSTISTTWEYLGSVPGFGS